MKKGKSFFSMLFPMIFLFALLLIWGGGKKGALDPLVLLARSDSIAISREVASAFNNLSAVDVNKAEITDRAAATIVALALSNDPETEKHACCTIANLAEMLDLHEKVSTEFSQIDILKKMANA